MEHQRGVHSIEGTRVEQQLLAAAALLGGSADDEDPSVPVATGRGERDSGQRDAAGYEVMGAGVPETGESVVLDHVRHGAAAGSTHGR